MSPVRYDLTSVLQVVLEGQNFRNYIQRFAAVLADVKFFMVSARSLFNETSQQQFFKVPCFQEKELIVFCPEAANASKPISHR